jgi:hypothetical protein
MTVSVTAAQRYSGLSTAGQVSDRKLLQANWIVPKMKIILLFQSRNVVFKRKATLCGKQRRESW